MQADSKPVTSNQRHTHPKLPALVRRYLASASKKPIAPHNLKAFDAVLQQLQAEPRPLILDSFCGTGHSTAALAANYPDHLVIGIDKSASRLSRHPDIKSSNYLLLQAECEDIWRLMLDAQLRPEYHYLLYPNPWPKSEHIQRRIHGSPAFASLLALGGSIELRSNWQIYVEEFGLAIFIAGQFGLVQQLPSQPPLTLFERKYQHSGHVLWRFLGSISTDAHS